MAFQVSPGVQVKEVDLTTVIPAVSTSQGGFVGSYSWGPVEEIVDIPSEDDLKKVFAKPKITDAVDYTTASMYLKYGENLRNVRVIDSVARNATSDEVESATLIKNSNVSRNTQTKSLRHQNTYKMTTTRFSTFFRSERVNRLFLRCGVIFKESDADPNNRLLPPEFYCTSCCRLLLEGGRKQRDISARSTYT